MTPKPQRAWTVTLRAGAVTRAREEDHADVPAPLGTEPLVGVGVDAGAVAARGRRGDQPSADWVAAAGAEREEPRRRIGLGEVEGPRGEDESREPAGDAGGRRPPPPLEPDGSLPGVEDVDPPRGTQPHAQLVAVRPLLQHVDLVETGEVPRVGRDPSLVAGALGDALGQRAWWRIAAIVREAPLEQRNLVGGLEPLRREAEAPGLDGAGARGGDEPGEQRDDER